MPNPVVEAMPNPADLEALDAVLADFDLDAGEEETIIEEPEIEAEAEVTPVVLEDAALADLDLALERTEIYENQTSPSLETVEPVKPAPKQQKARKASGPAVPRTPRDISKVPDEFFVLTGDPATLTDEEKAEARKTTMALKPNQVKVAEKFENLFTALSAGKAPSTYVMIAFQLLDTKKTVSSGDIVGAYKASGLGEGTARSQSGQIMNLFATVGIATRSGQSLAIRSDSLVAERLRSLSAPAAA